jgi:hypothetical protein
MFTGDSKGEHRYESCCLLISFTLLAGNVFKWEQMQSNQTMYSSERLLKLEGKKNLSEILVQAISLGDPKTNKVEEKKDSHSHEKNTAPVQRIKTIDERLPAYYVRQRSTTKVRQRERGIGGYVSQYAHLQNTNGNESLESIAKTAKGKAIIRILFVEKFDLIIASSEDASVYVWGFDQEALKALTTLRDQPNDLSEIEEGQGHSSNA